MKNLKNLLSITILALTTSAMAMAPEVGAIASIGSDNDHGAFVSTLDEQCIIAFTGYTFGSYSGNMTWPGGNGQYYMTGICFSNSCTPDEAFCTYCIDLDHELEQNPYCVEIDSIMVSALYPEQTPALAYIMTWYPVTTDVEDRIQQLSVWKLSTDLRQNEPTYLTPYYYANAGRGYPAIADPPVFPYVNTVYNSDAAVNDPANLHILDALGFGDDALAKNVVLCDDQLLIATGDPVISGNVSTIPVTVTLQRGLRALAVNNLSLSGVKLVISVDNGSASETEAFTNVAGEISFTVSQDIPTFLESNLRICSYSVWPRTVTPCNPGADHQQLLVQQQTEGSLCSLCVDLTIPGDQFLAVELNEFNAIAGDHAVTLHWQTASETDNDHFDISRNSTLVGRVNANGNGTGSSYQWTENNLNNGTEYTYSVSSIDVNGAAEQIFTISATPTMNAATITEYALHQNYPNPFNPETSITFDVAEASQVMLTVYNPLGQTVATLVNGTVEAGRHSVSFDAANLPSGLYFYRMDAGQFSAIKKMVLMK